LAKKNYKKPKQARKLLIPVMGQASSALEAEADKQATDVLALNNLFLVRIVWARV
jgi:hypothetical protein